MAKRKGMSLALRRKLYLVAAGFFFIIGILGLFLPILQGVLFLLVSMILYARGSARGRMLRRKFVKRHPQWGVRLDVAEHWLATLPHRIKRRLRLR